MKQTILFISILIIIIQALSLKAILDINKLSTIKEIPYIKVEKPKYKLLGFQSTKQEIKEAVLEQFGHKMAKIVECESGFKLKAYNPTNTNGTTDSGLFQINSSHKKKAKEMKIDLDTVQGQFEYAKFLVDKNGHKDWVCARKLGLL